MAGTTPVLSKGFLSIVLVVQVHFESRVWCDLLVTIFNFISWRRLWETSSTSSLPRQKSYMVLTRSMATINDVQKEASTTALEKQVRTLATAMERLTKQNHDLEEQLNQKKDRKSVV